MGSCCPAQEGEPVVKGDSKAGRAVPPPKGEQGCSPTALQQGEQSRPEPGAGSAMLQ